MFRTIWFGMNELSKDRIWSETIDLFIAISMFTYFIKTKDYKGLGLIAFWTLFFIASTSFTSIIILSKNPLAARDITGRLDESGQINIIVKLTKMGLGRYGFFASEVFIFPVIIGCVKYSKYNKISKTLYVAVISFLFYALIKANYFANIIICISFVIISLIGKNEFKKSIYLSLSILIFIIILPYSFYIDFLKDMAVLFNNHFIYDKIKDLNLFLIGSGHGHTEMDLRASRLPLLFNSFLK